MLRKGLDKHNGIYQDWTTQAHLYPYRVHPALWFLVELGSLKLHYLKFVNRRSRKTFGYNLATLFAGLNNRIPKFTVLNLC